MERSVPIRQLVAYCLISLFVGVVASALLASAFLRNGGGGGGGTVDDSKCRGLTLSGGGSKGSYEVGVIKGLAENCDDLNWDVVTGTSVGAINTLGATAFNIGDENAYADFLIEKWGKIKGSQTIYKSWKNGGVVSGFLFHPGIYDSSPLREFLKNEILKDDIYRGNRNISITATDMSDPGRKYWNENENATVMLEAVMAATAIPGVFPPVHVDGHWYNDGGVLTMVDVERTVLRCLEKVGNARDVIIDVILAYPADHPGKDSNFKPGNTLDQLLRAAWVREIAWGVELVQRTRKLWPDVTFRHMVQPKQSFSTMDLDFGPRKIQKMMAAGRLDGAAACRDYKRRQQGGGDPLFAPNAEIDKHAKSTPPAKVGVDPVALAEE